MEGHLPSLEPDYLERVVEMALREDIGSGDLTTESLIDPAVKASAQLIAREEAVVAGLEVFRRVFLHLDPRTTFVVRVRDGERAHIDQVIIEMTARAEALLKGERTALNFVQHLSGIATRTRLFLDQLVGLPVTLLDTRKTTPGLRPMEKYAVRVAGAGNHRSGLFDGILIKDNHHRMISDLPAAVARLRKLFPLRPVEIECQNLEEVEQALASGAETLLLDNMSLKTMTEAVRRVAGRCTLEASGNINLANVRDVAQTGVHFISAGTIIHGATFIDLSLEFTV